MTDRELLELAAKAAASAGMPIIQTEAGPQILERTTNEGEVYRIWNTPINAGDTLTLAVKFRMGIHYETQFIDGKDVEIVEVYYSHNEEDHSCKVVAEVIGDNADAATMRAIVRAAAEIQL